MAPMLAPRTLFIREAIIWINDDPVPWSKYTTLGQERLMILVDQVYVFVLLIFGGGH